jgi:tRNA threonylcarbamoyladenosine biosynthesis protein TsaB
MKALAIDSAALALTVAAKNDDGCVLVTLKTGTRQSEKLPGAIMYVLEQLAMTPDALDYMALCKGPGSFTSLRLAFAALKALQLTCKRPIYAVPTLEAYALPFAFYRGAVVPAIDAKQNRFYSGVYRRGACCSPAADIAPDALLTLLDPEEPVLVTGPDAPLLCDCLRGIRPELNISVYKNVNATDALFTLAEKMIAAGGAPLLDWEGPEDIRESVG